MTDFQKNLLRKLFKASTCTSTNCDGSALLVTTSRSRFSLLAKAIPAPELPPELDELAQKRALQYFRVVLLTVSTLSVGLPIKSPKKMALRMQRHFAISPLGLSGQDNSTATRVQHRSLLPIQA